MKQNLLIISENHCETFGKEYSLLKDYFNILYAKNLPSMVDLLKSTNTYYYLDNDVKLKNKLKYKIIRILNKNFNDLIVIKNFFKTNLNKEAIILSYDLRVSSWINEHYPDDVNKNISWNLIKIKTENRKRIILNKIKKLLNNKNKQAVNKNFTGKIIMLNEFDEDLVQLIQYKYPNAKYYFRYVDAVFQKETDKTLSQLIRDNLMAKEVDNIKENITKLKTKKFDVQSYNKLEAEFFNIEYIPNRVNFNKLRSLLAVDYANLNNPWFFAGNCEGRRFNCMLNLIKSLLNANIPCKFIMIGLKEEQKQQIRYLTQHNNVIDISFSYIPYDEYLKYQIQSPVFIDLYRLYPDEGLSYRTGEALALNKNIITNRTSIVNEEFFDKDKILVTDDFILEPKRLKALCNLDKNYDENLIKNFDINYTNSIVKSI